VLSEILNICFVLQLFYFNPLFIIIKENFIEFLDGKYFKLTFNYFFFGFFSPENLLTKPFGPYRLKEYFLFVKGKLYFSCLSDYTVNLYGF